MEISPRDSVCLRITFRIYYRSRADINKGNPTLLGLLGFLIPYTSTCLILCGFQGADPPTSLIGLTGDYYFIGGIAMILAGIAEFILGNSMFLLLIQS